MPGFSYWYEGLLGLSYWQSLVAALLLTHITILSVTLYLHRHSAHRALELHGALKHFFRFWLWLTTGMGTKAWTAIHRKHHAQCETEEDPHSPVVLGLRKVLWQGAELYQQSDIAEVREKYGRGTPDDWLERNLYRHNAAGISLMLLIDLLLFGVIGLSVWAVQMLWIPFFAAGVINGVGHAAGYRNFECADAARNIFPWGILIGGEELHNNHHTYPNSPKLSVKWWEFDIGWMWIKIFSFLGLAKVRSRGPIAERLPGKQVIDMDTAWGALNDRFHIMAQYSRKVVTPRIKLEIQSAAGLQKRLLKQARKLMCRAPILNQNSFDAGPHHNEVISLVREHPSLKLIYEMRKALDEIWLKGSHSSAEMVEALKDWCHRAEESGVDALRDFAAYLRSYSIARTASPDPA